uniref:Prohibitin n=1 Tax=Aureoumbra lagunensis TaxID=44058 RepID=A0A7S3NH81_9STRA|mmetsp:Transcript_7724/g.10756  ORF Transcript_7724/g.10756 Transcript_7724/m.10756 type:complete len:333 (+) Transcript_7724:83-1081(+)
MSSIRRTLGVLARRQLSSMRDRLNDLGSQMPTGGGGGGNIMSALVGIGGLGFLGYNSFFTVQGGERAVLWSRIAGVKESVYNEGMHPKIPLIEYPISFDVRTRPRNVQSLTGSKDLQMINITLRVLSKPSIPDLPFIYKRLGHDYDDRVLPSIVNEVTKAVVACYNASELLTKREQVSQEIRNRLLRRSADFRIVLEDVSITHLSFSSEYTAAVEAKQVAQQDAERSRYIVEKAIQEKKSIIVKAEGEAQSATLIGKAIQNNPGFVQLRKIETAKEIASTIARAQSRVYLDANNLLLNALGNENLATETVPATKSKGTKSSSSGSAGYFSSK